MPALTSKPPKTSIFGPKPTNPTKNQQKSAFSAEKPKKTVEIRSFSIDFARPKAALF
jgi:hypothetical protein